MPLTTSGEAGLLVGALQLVPNSAFVLGAVDVALADLIRNNVSDAATSAPVPRALGEAEPLPG
jgi:hypothetical protein